MEPKLAHVKLADILVSKTNEMFRDQAELTEDALKELIESIKVNGVISPILLRPKEKKFELICGERRFRAAKAAGLDLIPANIKELTDEQAFELQVTENLQRKDVHPLKEANAYHFLQLKDPKLHTAAELARRFGKTEHYILTRLKLVDLIPEAKKDFQAGLMSIGHALAIARLQEADQKELLKQCTDSLRSGKREVKYYNSIQELEDLIDDTIICDLNDAAFDKADPNLLPKAGACVSCPKRSGANQLFADISEKDRCFDRKCFTAKREQFLITQIPVLLEKEPDTVFIEEKPYGYKSTHVKPEIAKVLKENRVQTLKEFSTWAGSGSRLKIQGIYVNGDHIGKKAEVYIEKVKADKDGVKKVQPGISDTKEALARIDERLERAIELDAEKVYARILEALKAHPSQKEPNISYYTQAEDAMLNYILLDALGYGDDDDVREKLNLPKEDDEDHEYPQKLFAALSKLDTADRMFLMRKVMLQHKFTANPRPTTPEAYFIRKVAESYKDIPITQFEAEQDEVRKKREANADKRKVQLKADKKKDFVKKATQGGSIRNPGTAKPTMGKGLAALLKPGKNGKNKSDAKKPAAGSKKKKAKA